MASSCSNSMGNSAYFSGLIWVCDLFSYEVRELTFLLAVRKQHVCNFPYFPSGRMIASLFCMYVFLSVRPSVSK